VKQRRVRLKKRVIYDLTGRVFGLWRVLKRSELRSASRSSYWTCICRGCRRQHAVCSRMLRAGKSQSCLSCATGKLRREYSKLAKDLLERGMGYAEAAEKIGVSEDSVRRWAPMFVRPSKRGRPAKDETGTRYGLLTLSERIGDDGNRGALWRAECECGAMVAISGKRMRRGDAMRSCVDCRPKLKRVDVVRNEAAAAGGG